MEELQAIGTAYLRVAGRARVSSVMVYAALLQLLDEGAPAAAIRVSDIEEKSGCSAATVARCLKDLAALQCITIDRDPRGHAPSKFKHTYVPRQKARS